MSVLEVFNCAKETCALPGKACVECGKAQLPFFYISKVTDSQGGVAFICFFVSDNEVGLLRPKKCKIN